ncbi:MAG TPA: RelA/SpoT domain-containing protein [Aquella sp.]|nr:RelA/SpoT domain-containing protein [Aquella sp.]
MKISKSSVDSAGEKLRQNQNDGTALDILAAWRNKHVYALRTAFNLLKRHTDKVGNNAIYGQRLKRVSSILHKLDRLPTMKLSQLQDIGGCRVIITNYEKLRSLYTGLKKSKSISPKHKDYITYPKKDGYRGIHLIYTCNSKNIEYSGLKIEFQLRTKLQHAWATAVEIIDSFEGEELKLGKGSQKWRRFFYLVADEFASFEQLPLHDNTIEDRLSEIKQLYEDLNVKDKFQSYPIVIERANKKDANFLILLLDTKQKQISIRPFKKSGEAQDFYIAQEKMYINEPSHNILMVKMDSITPIRKSYPNYFADSKFFLEQLNTILAK